MIPRAAAQAALLLALAAAAAGLTWQFHPDRPALYLAAESADPDEISVADALALEKSRGVIWVDARSNSQFALAHIPGAIRLTDQEWSDLMFPFIKILDADDARRPLVIYCDAQKCAASKAVRNRLRYEVPIGDREVHVLHGGWPAWQAATASTIP
jgi:rhodanese-related sulfurtransferase